VGEGGHLLLGLILRLTNLKIVYDLAMFVACLCA